MPLRDATREVIQQADEMINLARNHYSDKSDLSMSSIGVHIRHIIDHFWAFQEGFSAGFIDYNCRHRDTDIERNPDFAHTAMKVIQRWFDAADMQLIKPLQVRSEISTSHSEIAVIDSNSSRELLFLINHTLHHLAYAGLLAKSYGLKIPEKIGVAPATASYLRQKKSQ